MIFNVTGGGGGAALNFKVVAYATEAELLATAPAENTIGIITDVEITSYAFGTEEPAEPEAGMVWITTGTSSTVAFNALKKNAIQVCPLSAMQYVDGAWVSVTAMSYQGGEWVSWWDGVLYEPGDTSGLTALAWAADSSQAALSPTISYGASAVTIAISADIGGKTGVAYFEARDLTPYSTLEMDYTTSGNILASGSAVGIYVWKAVGTGYYLDTAVARYIIQSLTTGKATIDVSALQGEYYIGIGVRRHEGNLTLKTTGVKLSR